MLVSPQVLLEELTALPEFLAGFVGKEGTWKLADDGKPAVERLCPGTNARTHVRTDGRTSRKQFLQRHFDWPTVATFYV